MTNTEIVKLLREFKDTRSLMKQKRLELIIAANSLGVSQKECTKIDIITFLDGYLIGQGMWPVWRDEYIKGENNEY